MPEGRDEEHVELVEVGPFVDAHLQPSLRAFVPLPGGHRHAAAGFELPDVHVADAIPRLVLQLAVASADAETFAQFPETEVAEPNSQIGEIADEHSEQETARLEVIGDDGIGREEKRGDDEDAEEGESLEEVQSGPLPASEGDAAVGVACVVGDVDELAIVGVGASQDAGVVVDEAEVVEERGELGHVLRLATTVDAAPAIVPLGSAVHVDLEWRRARTATRSTVPSKIDQESIWKRETSIIWYVVLSSV